MNDKALTKRLIEVAASAHWRQKPAVSIIIALLGLALVLMIVTMNIIKYESHLATGDTVLLALAPVDPRGFMQGDYMTLSYALENEVFAALNIDPGSYPTNEQGYVIVTVDENNVGQFSRLVDAMPDPLSANERAIYYRLRSGTLKLATNAFFFQEGHAEAFENAEYGLFRVNDKGAPLLTHMVDKNFIVIHPEDKSKQMPKVE